MESLIFEKTEKGQEEIAHRTYHLQSRQRTLLLLVDGKKNVEELLAKTAGLGLKEDVFADLLVHEFIRIVPVQHAVVAEPVVETPPPVTAVSSVAQQPHNNVDDALQVWAPLSDDEPLLKSGQTQIQAIYAFFTDTIKSMIGLRGYSLQLKVERAGTLEEFRDLRRPYLDAVLRAKGKEVERGLRRRLDELLYMNDVSPHLTTTILSAEKQA